MNVASLTRLPKFGNLSYSLRRLYVDEFLERQSALLPEGCGVLDLGGSREYKRGSFDLARRFQPLYLNISAEKRPDVAADGALLPFPDQSFEAVICSEVLEHVPDPRLVLDEIARVLKPGGCLLLTVPFLFRIHADPHDFGRYTDTFWHANLTHRGFVDIAIEPQGLFWSVLVDMLRGLLYASGNSGLLRVRGVRRVLAALIVRLKRFALSRDLNAQSRADPYLMSYTTGFGIAATAGGQRSD